MPSTHSSTASLSSGLEPLGEAYESLVLPTTGFITRTTGSGNFAGQVCRFHIGLENPEDLIADLRHGLSVLREHGR